MLPWLELLCGGGETDIGCKRSYCAEKALLLQSVHKLFPRVDKPLNDWGLWDRDGNDSGAEGGPESAFVLVCEALGIIGPGGL